MPKQKPNEQVQQIPLSEIRPFKNHPFKVTDDELMQQTIDSIMQVGVLNPAIIRPAPEGGYEMVAGHRRLHAADLAGLKTIPAIVRNLDDDEAVILMVDSNLQRETISPMERAQAYKMKLEALKHQGKRVDLQDKSTSRQVGEKSWAVAKVGADANESERQVHRYIRLTELLPEVQKKVDSKEIAFSPAVELSYLTRDEQKQFLDAMDYSQNTPSLSQAQRLKKLSREGKCTKEAMRSIMSEEKKEEQERITLSSDKAKHLSFRKIPLKQFRLLGRAALIFSIALALMVVPTTITMASAYRALSNDYASWESLKDAVGISYNDVNGLYNDYWMPMVENFFAEMADRDNLCLSMAVDRAIVLDNAKMGKYDHIVVTDRAWVETTVFGDNSDKADSLIPIGFDDIHAELKDFLSKQLPIWTNTGEIQPEGMGFCEFNGDSFLVLPPNASYGNSTIQAKNPLIILVEEPVKTLKVSSFLLPMSSSGNIVFKNEAVLRSVLNESPLMEKISSIDSFTEGALKYAQLFKQESFYYFAACALCLVSMGAAGIMSAQLWIGENRKRIFTLHTAGIKYSAIILPVLRKEVIVAVCTVLVGGIVVYSIRHPEPLLLLLSSAVLFLMYVLLNFVGYIFFSKREFLQMSFRRE